MFVGRGARCDGEKTATGRLWGGAAGTVDFSAGAFVADGALSVRAVRKEKGDPRRAGRHPQSAAVESRKRVPP